MPQIRDLVKYLRSKNAGPRALSLDMIFPDRQTFEWVRDSSVITEERIRRLYCVPEGPVLITPFEQALAIKVTIPRRIPSGNVGDSDLYGAQRFVPIMNLTIPGEPPRS